MKNKSFNLFNPFHPNDAKTKWELNNQKIENFIFWFHPWVPPAPLGSDNPTFYLKKSAFFIQVFFQIFIKYTKYKLRQQIIVHCTDGQWKTDKFNSWRENRFKKNSTMALDRDKKNEVGGFFIEKKKIY